MKVDSIEVSGSLKIGDSCECEELEISGSGDVQTSLKSGKLEVSGKLEAETIESTTRAVLKIKHQQKSWERQILNDHMMPLDHFPLSKSLVYGLSKEMLQSPITAGQNHWGSESERL